MKLYLILSFIMFALCSCTKEKEVLKQQLPIKIYSEKDLAAKIKIRDTVCINDTRRAEEDIKNGKLSINTFYIYRRIVNDSMLGGANYPGMDIEKLIAPHLQKFGITIDNDIILISCIRRTYDDLFDENCYEERMKEEIEARFGKYFIDSLAKVEEKKYVKNHPEIIYSNKSFDPPSETKAINYYSFINIRENEFKDSFIYPKDYKFKNEKAFSYTSTDFILMKDGTIKDIEIEIEFQNPENEKFRKYFKNRVTDFIKNTKWLSPTCSGIPVNAQLSFSFFHK